MAGRYRVQLPLGASNSVLNVAICWVMLLDVSLGFSETAAHRRHVTQAAGSRAHHSAGPARRSASASRHATTGLGGRNAYDACRPPAAIFWDDFAGLAWPTIPAAVPLLP